VVVAGCLVQRHKTQLIAEQPGIDRLVGVFDRDHIVEAVRGKLGREDGHFLGRYHALTREETGEAEFATGDTSKAAEILRKQAAGKRGRRLPVFEDDRARLRLTPRHFAYLRMSEGCNQGCAFCTIPSIRGPMRSKPMEQILAEARELAADGAVELLLIGQDTTSYGTDIGYAPGLSGLLLSLDAELPPDVAWVRLMYAYPSCFTDEMIDTLARLRRVVPYVDMPLQHINDEVLARMKRKVTRHETLTLLDKLRDRVPGIALRTTFISGSPGESEAEHEELVDFIRQGYFEHLGVFAYSPEPGTPMGRMAGQVDEETKQRRLEELMLAQQEVVFARNAERVGEVVEVLIDADQGEADEGQRVYTARTRGQAPDIDSVTYVASERPLHPGQILDVEVTDYQHYDLVAIPKRRAGRPLNVIGSSRS
jgi:ribosomal protein S12 methylthiotransferase